MTTQNGFAALLRGHRRAARLTLEQLAEASGVSARTLSDIERGRSRGPQHRTVTALADALALDGDTRTRFLELARDGRLEDHWNRPASGLHELPCGVADFTGRSQELIWMSDLVYTESAPGVGVVGLITGSAGLGKTTLAVRAAHTLLPSFPDGAVLLDLFGLSPHPLPVPDALRRQGIGARLMDELRALAAAGPGCSRVEWMTDRDNPGTRAFHESRGFTESDGKIVYRIDSGTT
ncbi:GNAT family N-acetyltransferase [Streptomyces sp. NPDC048278]|uniref:GNAT family N-acetyltransferase n=1 Tax=Streptomyces sp. NPDC048278 TaxID=3155809 RepID=UPI003429F2B3